MSVGVRGGGAVGFAGVLPNAIDSALAVLNPRPLQAKAGYKDAFGLDDDIDNFDDVPIKCPPLFS